MVVRIVVSKNLNEFHGICKENMETNVKTNKVEVEIGGLLNARREMGDGRQRTAARNEG